MARRFTSKQLYVLRNEIPIDRLIERYLSIPCHRSEKRFRFACPLCGGFKTSILWEKNLSRCFQCNKNFNTIDLVIHIMNVDFVESVRRLEKYHARIIKLNTGPISARKTDSFVPIGKVIADILPQKPVEGIKRENAPDDNQAMSGRIDELETKIENLSLQIEKLCQTLLAK
jgi:hypothetical protein